MALNVQTFSQVVSRIATAMQARAGQALDFTVGSTLRAIAEAQAGVMLWLQAMILQVLTLTRASTSVGTDLDSFFADFNLARLPAVAATGQVTFARFTPTQQALIPVGATIQTADGTQQFAVTVDIANAAYSPAQDGYVIAAGTASVSAPVIAANLGTQGNVQPGSISQITGSIPYVDTVANPAAFINGIDAEADQAYRDRFKLYIASLSKGTKVAYDYAVRSTRQGVTDQILENQNYDLSPNKGYSAIVVDDGTGYPSLGLLNAVAANVDAVRSLTVGFGIFAPTVVVANISATLTTASTYDHLTVVNQVIAALQSAINAIPLGSGLPYSYIASVIYGVPGVTNATGILLNNATVDIAADPRVKLVAGTQTVA